MSVDFDDGPDPIRPLDRFGDGLFWFRFFVLPARRSIALVRAAEMDTRLTDQLLDAATDWVARRLDLKRDPRWKVVLLRYRKDRVFGSPPAVVMAELVGSETEALERVHELSRTWRSGESYVDREPISLAALRREIKRSQPSLGPILIGAAATPPAPLADRGLRGWAARSDGSGDLSPRVKQRVGTGMLSVMAALTTYPAGLPVCLLATVGAGVLGYAVFGLMVRDDA